MSKLQVSKPRLQLAFAVVILLSPALLYGTAALALAQPDSRPAAVDTRKPDSLSSGQSGPSKADSWAGIEAVSRILSIAAIPIVIAVGGWLVQKRLQEQSVRKDYVQLAISILREPSSEKVGTELKGWAVDLLNAYSEVKLTQKVSRTLKEGKAVLPPLERFEANPSPALTPELENEMQAALTTFQQRLKESGFSIRAAGTIKYEVVPGDAIETGSGEYYAFYDPDILTMKVASAYAGDLDVIRHEYMRHVLGDPDHGPISVEPGSGWWKSFAVSSGLAVYFPCSFKGSPVFAANHPDLRVDLENSRKFRGPVNDMIRADKIGDQVWGGTFWDLRGTFDDPKSADHLLASAWGAWRPKDPDANLFVEFANKLIEIDRLQNNGQHVTEIQAILRKRGLRI